MDPEAGSSQAPHIFRSRLSSDETDDTDGVCKRAQIIILNTVHLFQYSN